MATTKRRKEEEYIERFKAGTAVEVSSEDAGLRGSWYTATVITPITRSCLQILVEYHNLLVDDTCSVKLREFVDALLIRPIPPIDPTPVFRVMDDVDAFHNDGWWEGVVTIVHPHHYYSVFFRCSREQIRFPASDLRLHREWVTGNEWRPPLHPHPHPHLHPPSTSSQKRKNGDDDKNGGHSPGGSANKARKTETRDVGRRNSKSPAKRGGGSGGGGGGGSGVVMKNGRVRDGVRDSNRSVTMAARTREIVCAIGVHKKPRVTINGTIKDPRRRASNHTGGRASKK